MHTISEWWMWVGFFIFIVTMLSVDMFLLGGKKSHRVSMREALGWVIVWVTLALMFNLLLWWYLRQTAGPVFAMQKALEFTAGYLIEESLSIDNMFVFVMLFQYFAVPAEYQRRVLLLGVLGAIVMRLVMILLGVVLVSRFQWILYLFGVFLVFTGIKMIAFAGHKPDLDKNPLLLWMRRHLRLTERYHQEAFFVKEGMKWCVTPLFLVLVLVEISDLIFSFDSIPAIFAITADPFIVFTSNIFAILGLRSLYFLVANMMDRFHLLQYGVALILIFVGCKMLVAHWFAIPITMALSVVVVILVSSICASVMIPFAK